MFHSCVLCTTINVYIFYTLLCDSKVSQPSDNRFNAPCHLRNTIVVLRERFEFRNATRFRAIRKCIALRRARVTRVSVVTSLSGKKEGSELMITKHRRPVNFINRLILLREQPANRVPIPRRD